MRPPDPSLAACARATPAYQEIQRVAPNATIVGPSFAGTPQRMPQE
ncbi:hypothetical protein [Rugosimonospora acidiphila]